jgi:FMN reductase [NAD(P)H]
MRPVELADILRRRRMVRSYVPDPVPRETVERIVATVRRAPSGGFSQGHRLVVVTEPDTRRELARLAGEEEYVAAGGQAWISTAPVHVFVGTREESYPPAPDPGESALASRLTQRRLPLEELVRWERWDVPA